MTTVYSGTSRAFDAHAQHYDSIVEPNALLQTMRAALWREVRRRVSLPAHLLDIGCGTGIDAAYFARNGYRVTAIDSSPEMVRQTRARVSAVSSTSAAFEPRMHATEKSRMPHKDLQGRENAGAPQIVRVLELGAQELDKLGGETFDAIYSDLGPLNCVPELDAVSQQCAAHLKPGGCLLLSVMARVCPWEIAYFTLRGEFTSAVRRFHREMIPVNLENGVVWTRYYSPQEFFSFFANDFSLVICRALNLVLPPPYLIRWYNRAGALAGPIRWLDETFSTLPMFRNMGDHFLMVLQK